MQVLPLFTDKYLFSHWEQEFSEFVDRHDATIRQSLIEWTLRDKGLSELQLEGLFVDKFFRQLWGYWGTGTTGLRPDTL
jgi:hypothetical protein